MAELQQILDLWKRARATGEEICVATVVGVEGSAYRRPGARMLLAASGLRAGTISGGCLEAEVTKKAWWLTEQGPSLQRYSSFFDDDGDMPYGLGCGGTVFVLLERGEPAHQALEVLRRSVEERTASVIVASRNAAAPGTILILDSTGAVTFERDADGAARTLAREALNAGTSRQAGDLFAEYAAPPPALLVFGAGDDARPLVDFALSLGWHVTVADGRSHLATRERFRGAAAVGGLAPAIESAQPSHAAVIMTHSYEQDRQLLRALLPRPLRYLGILGPRTRTERLVGELAPELGLAPEACMARLHTPVGLDLGGHAPAAIALSIAAELQAVFAGRPIRIPSAPPAHV